MTEYNLSNIQQLVDLNEDLADFISSFSVNSLDGRPFLVAIVSQQDIDSGAALPFETIANGSKSGQIKSQGQGFKNYYIALKSADNSPCRVLVNITKQDLSIKNSNGTVSSASTASTVAVKHYKRDTMSYLLLFGVIAFLFIAVMTYYKRKKERS